MNSVTSNKKRSVFKKIFNTLSWIAFVLLITVAIFLLLVLVTNKISEKKHSKPMMGLYTIISPSMTGTINVYDVVFVLNVPTKFIHRGDVITFRAEDVIFGDTPVTHRVIEKYTDSNGEAIYVTKGDANQYKDDFKAYERNLVGKVMFKIPQLGRIQFFLVSKKGWFVVVLVPALAIIAYDVFKVLKTVLIKNEQEVNIKTEEKLKDDQESDENKIDLDD